jgi:glycosyltransferase involved in cell wall biosynthesis
VPAIFIGYATSPTPFGGVRRVNQAIARILGERFDLVAARPDADLQICSLDWNAPPAPPRLFVDHGSFADAGFWAYMAPRLRTTDTILVSSRVCLEVADRMLGAERPRLALVPYFADTDGFRRRADPAAVRANVAASLGIPADGPLLLTVSGYSRRKNLDLSLRLLHRVVETVPTARLALVGRPSAAQSEHAAELRRLAETLGVARRVHFVDTMSHADLQLLMASATLLVHLTTCRLENFGLVVAEALASGLPVIAADWGGLRDLVRDGENGALAETFLTRRGPRVDWLGASDAALELLVDPRRHRSLAENAERAARAELGLAPFAERLATAVEQAARASAAAARTTKLSPRGEDLMFATIQLDMRHRQKRRASDAYSLLLDSDPELVRFLSGPAATHERPPVAQPDDRLYAWPVATAAAPGSPLARALLAAADGERTLGELATILAPTPQAELLAEARALLDDGALCRRIR